MNGIEELAAQIDSFEMHAPPPLTDSDAPNENAGPAITADETERLLDEDVGSVLRRDVFSKLMNVRENDAPEWARIQAIFRRKRMLKEFTDHARKHDAKPKMRAPNAAWEVGLSCRINAQGEYRPENILSNLVYTLKNHPAWQGVLGFDLFSGHITTRNDPPFDRSGQWDDGDDLSVKMWFETNTEMRPKTQLVHEAIFAAARSCSFNPLTDWLTSLRDDGDNFLDTWLQRCFGAPDTEYVRAVGKMWIVSAVARAYNPGCQVDTVLILEGEQGLRKSTVLKSLCPDPSWFNDKVSEFGSKAQAEEIQGKWIIEIAELDAFGKAEASKIKSFVTRQTETYRPAYGHYVVTVPRQCVLAGTVNPGATGYLKDSTGNRRFWPVKCTTKAEQITKEFRDQLFAEAVKAWANADDWWITTPELEALAKAEQDERVALDPWHDQIGDFLSGQFDTSVDEVLKKLIPDVGRWQQSDAVRVGKALSAHKWVQYRVTKGEHRPRRYHAPGIAQPVPADPPVRQMAAVRSLFPD